MRLTHSPENAFNWNVSDRVVWRRNLYRDRWCRYEHWLNLFVEFLSTYVHKTFLRWRIISINIPSECDPFGTLQRSEQMQFAKRQTTARLLRCQNVWLAPETPVTWIVNLHVKLYVESLTIDSEMQTVHSRFGNAPKTADVTMPACSIMFGRAVDAIDAARETELKLVHKNKTRRVFYGDSRARWVIPNNANLWGQWIRIGFIIKNLMKLYFLFTFYHTCRM